jgi:predicted ATPase
LILLEQGSFDMRALDRIEIEGFKSIRHLELDLQPLNVLIGANGAGKTNFIGVFKLLNHIVKQRMQSYVAESGGADSFLYYGRKITNQIRIKVKFGANTYEVVLSPTVRDSFYFATEVGSYQGPDYSFPYTFNLGSGHAETLLFEESRRYGKLGIAGHIIDSIDSWQIYHFHDTSPSAGVKLIRNINDNEYLRPDASNLAAFLYLLRKKSFFHYDQIVKTIRLVAPFFDDFNLRPFPDDPNKIKLEWREKKSDAYFDASALSDGTLRFMCLATLLLQPNLPSTILIDEPELGLHPYAIVLLSGLVRSASTKTQLIVSTQSVPLVNQFAPEEVIVVDRQDEQSIFKRLRYQEYQGWLEEYGLGDLWEKNVIGGRPQR